jgi:hypothetical protein
MKLLIVYGLLLLYSCGQLSSGGASVCEGKSLMQPVRCMNEAGDAGASIEPTEKTGDQTLLLFRMLHTL